MPYTSMIMVTAHNKTAAETAQMWIDRRCIEEAAETIPGFQWGEVLIKDETANTICVLCVWSAKSDYDDWLESPVRAKQTEDIAPHLKADLETLCFEQAHYVKMDK